MRANGTHPRRVTHAGSRNEDANPTWSPHGHRLVFFRFDEKRGKDAVFVIRTDGKHAAHHSVEARLRSGCRLVSERTVDPHHLPSERTGRSLARSPERHEVPPAHSFSRQRIDVVLVHVFPRGDTDRHEPFARIGGGRQRRRLHDEPERDRTSEHHPIRPLGQRSGLGPAQVSPKVPEQRSGEGRLRAALSVPERKPDARGRAAAG
jgi:hypothetical protein